MYVMTNDEITNLARNAFCDKVAEMVKKGKAAVGLTEDEGSVAMAHAVIELTSAFEVYWQNQKAAGKTAPEKPLSVWIAVTIRATKNTSQMRQVCEDRKILVKQGKGGKVEDLFMKYGG